MNIQPYFKVTADEIRVHSTIISQSECKFCVGWDEIEVKPHEARIIALVMSAQQNSLDGGGISAKLAANMLGYSRAWSFRRAFANLSEQLSNHLIANEGGTGSIFHEESVTVADLLIPDDGFNGYRYNKPLAKRIPLSMDKTISEETLDQIRRELITLHNL